MTAYAQVGQYAINRCDVVQAKKPLQVTKVVWYKNHPLITRQILPGCFILVKYDQFSFFPQFRKNGFGMTTAAKSLGLIGFGRALIWSPNMPLAITVGVSILVIITWANTVGATIPMLATAFKIDPTIMSAPLIATLVDATGLFIYFMIARSILGL